MSKVIAITNQKGGSGKTTTTRELGFGLARQGKKVLLIDSDPQGSLSSSLGVENEQVLEYSLYNILGAYAEGVEDTIDLEKGIFHHEEGIDLMPCNISLCKIETQLNAMSMGKEFALKYYVDGLRDKYDYILIDCMPSLQILPINALVAADSVLVPIKPDFLNSLGMDMLMNTLSTIQRKGYNPRLSVEGILYTMVDMRRSNDRYFIENLSEDYGDKIKFFDIKIPLTVKGSEVSFSGMSIYKYRPNSKLAESYAELTREVLDND